MAVTVRKVVHNPRLRWPVIFMVSLIWLQVSVLIGKILPEEEEQYQEETSWVVLTDDPKWDERGFSASFLSISLPLH